MAIDTAVETSREYARCDGLAARLRRGDLENDSAGLNSPRWRIDARHAVAPPPSRVQPTSGARAPKGGRATSSRLRPRLALRSPVAGSTPARPSLPAFGRDGRLLVRRDRDPLHRAVEDHRVEIDLTRPCERPKLRMDPHLRHERGIEQSSERAREVADDAAQIDHSLDAILDLEPQAVAAEMADGNDIVEKILAHLTHRQPARRTGGRRRAGRLTTRLHDAGILTQNSGVVPSAWERSHAVSGITPRFPLTISLTR